MSHATESSVRPAQLQRPGVGIALVVAAACGWGLGTVSTSAVLDDGTTPELYTFIEVSAGLLTLNALVVIARSQMPRRAGTSRGALLGVLEPGLTYLIMNWGLSRTSATNGALIGAVQPAMVATIAWLVFRQRLRGPVLGFMAMALAGVALVVTTGGSSGQADLVGDLALVIGIGFASLYVVGSSRVVQSIDPLPLAALQHRWAWLVVTSALAIRVLVGDSLQWPSTALNWVLIVGTGVVSGAFTFWAYLTALQHIRPGIAAQFLALIPVVGFAGAVIWRGEQPTIGSLVGAVVVAVALFGIGRSESLDG